MTGCSVAAGRQGASVLTAALLLALAGGCATNPVTGEREFSLLSEGQEIAIGQEADAQVRQEMGLYDDPQLQAYVEGLGQRLAAESERPNLPWSFAVVDQPDVNAFALPGGFVYLTRGILPFLDSEAEMAGVLGHEIGHVTARHSAQAYTRSTAAGLGLALGTIFVPETRPFASVAEAGLGLLFLKHSRDDELQADELGAEYAAEGGWDPTGVPAMLGTLARLDEINAPSGGLPGWLATHPDPLDRIDQVSTVVAQLGHVYPDGTANRSGYLDHVDGVLFGPDPARGVIDGRHFLHPVLGFALAFPEGWDIVNGNSQVVSQPGDQSAAMVLQLVDLPAGSLDIGAVEWMATQGLREQRGSGTHINGLPAHVGIYSGVLDGIGPVTVEAAHIAHGDAVYLLAGIAPQAAGSAARSSFPAAIASFEPLAASEAAGIRSNRVRLHTVRAGDTWEALASRAARDRATPDLLAALNHGSLDREPTVGSRIKIVVAD